MRFPVSYERYAHALERARRAEKNADWWSTAAAEADARLRAQGRRYDELLAKYHELAAPKPAALSGPAAIQVPTTQAPPDALTTKIREEAAGDSRVAAHFWKFAREELAEGKTREEVAELIGWTTATDGAEGA